MTPRENLLSLLRRQGYGTAPYYFQLCPAQVEQYHRHYGKEAGPYQEVLDFPMRTVSGHLLLDQPFSDWPRYYQPKQFVPEQTVFIEWGVALESTPESMHMHRMHHPMQRFTTLAEFENYPYPGITLARLQEIEQEIAEIHSNGYATRASLECTVWETAWYMRSMDEMMVGMMTDDEMTIYHLDRITALQKERVAILARAGVDIILLGDDIGMQHTIMMSKELYAAHLKWRLKEIIAAAKAARADVIIAYHSCGYVEPFIEDLIECGVEVLNPVQPECMDFADIHARYGDRLSFWGTVGTQTTMPHGTPAEVRETVFRNLEIAGPAGGLLCTPTHMVEPEVPWENIEAYMAACREFKN